MTRNEGKACSLGPTALPITFLINFLCSLINQIPRYNHNERISGLDLRSLSLLKEAENVSISKPSAIFFSPVFWNHLKVRLCYHHTEELESGRLKIIHFKVDI